MGTVRSGHRERKGNANFKQDGRTDRADPERTNEKTDSRDDERTNERCRDQIRDGRWSIGPYRHLHSPSAWPGRVKLAPMRCDAMPRRTLWHRQLSPLYSPLPGSTLLSSLSVSLNFVQSPSSHWTALSAIRYTKHSSSCSSSSSSYTIERTTKILPVAVPVSACIGAR